jgi:hypothetical protein
MCTNLNKVIVAESLGFLEVVDRRAVIHLIQIDNVVFGILVHQIQHHVGGTRVKNTRNIESILVSSPKGVKRQKSQRNASFGEDSSTTAMLVHETSTTGDQDVLRLIDRGRHDSIRSRSD